MRLQVQVLPPNAGRSQPAICSFLEIAQPTLTLEQLSLSIVRRYEKLYPHCSELNIHKLQDADFNDLDLSYSVSDVFTDKSDNKNDSVVRVIQSSALRESSLPPESGLRSQSWRKRRAAGPRLESIGEVYERTSSERSSKRPRVGHEAVEIEDSDDEVFTTGRDRRDWCTGYRGVQEDEHEASISGSNPSNQGSALRTTFSPELGEHVSISPVARARTGSGAEVEITGIAHIPSHQLNGSVAVKEEVPSSSPAETRLPRENEPLSAQKLHGQRPSPAAVMLTPATRPRFRPSHSPPPTRLTGSSSTKKSGRKPAKKSSDIFEVPLSDSEANSQPPAKKPRPAGKLLTNSLKAGSVNSTSSPLQLESKKSGGKEHTSQLNGDERRRIAEQERLAQENEREKRRQLMVARERESLQQLEQERRQTEENDIVRQQEEEQGRLAKEAEETDRQAKEKEAKHLAAKAKEAEEKEKKLQEREDKRKEENEKRIAAKEQKAREIEEKKKQQLQEKQRKAEEAKRKREEEKERKRLENEEKKKKQKEERERKAREAKELREKEAREKKEREKADREAKAREAKEKAENARENVTSQASKRRLSSSSARAESSPVPNSAVKRSIVKDKDQTSGSQAGRKGVSFAEGTGSSQLASSQGNLIPTPTPIGPASAQTKPLPLDTLTQPESGSEYEEQGDESETGSQPDQQRQQKVPGPSQATRARTRSTSAKGTKASTPQKSPPQTHRAESKEPSVPASQPEDDESESASGSSGSDTSETDSDTEMTNTPPISRQPPKPPVKQNSASAKPVTSTASAGKGMTTASRSGDIPKPTTSPSPSLLDPKNSTVGATAKSGVQPKTTQREQTQITSSQRKSLRDMENEPVQPVHDLHQSQSQKAKSTGAINERSESESEGSDSPSENGSDGESDGESDSESGDESTDERAGAEKDKPSSQQKASKEKRASSWAWGKLGSSGLRSTN